MWGWQSKQCCQKHDWNVLITFSVSFACYFSKLLQKLLNCFLSLQLLASPWVGFSQWTLKLSAKKVCWYAYMCIFVPFSRNRCHHFYYVINGDNTHLPAKRKLNVIALGSMKIKTPWLERGKKLTHNLGEYPHLYEKKVIK